MAKASVSIQMALDALILVIIMDIWVSWALQVCVASACDLFPDPNDDLLGVGVSPSFAAQAKSRIEDKVGEKAGKGTEWDSLWHTSKKARKA